MLRSLAGEFQLWMCSLSVRFRVILMRLTLSLSQDHVLLLLLCDLSHSFVKV